MRVLSAPVAGLAATLLAAMLVVTGPDPLPNRPADRFDHAEHRELFVSCATCHAGIEVAGRPEFPTARQCASCHDGTTEERVEWQPRMGPRAGNLVFDHLVHAADSALSCAACHTDADTRWMRGVRGPVATQCVDCHAPGRGNDHVNLPDTACATCHVPLTAARGMTLERVNGFEVPSSHGSDAYRQGSGHGVASRGVNGERVAASCATCHVQQTCLACHVDAPETVAIQALGADGPAMSLTQGLEEPASHEATDFEVSHGRAAASGPASCVTCHTQESCAACHVEVLPRAARALHPAGPGRAVGAQPEAALPSSHGAGWEDDHGAVAQAGMQTCTSCHVRQSCLTCHVPDPAKAGSYHPASYLVRHPAEAYTRSTSCADCHNQGQFCQSCHETAGLVATRTLIGEGGYHDGNRQFFVGHGQAARQSLESCASCHVESDCLTCHSTAAVGGRGFSPHGPGFDAEQMYRKNPTMCTACHGMAIPRR
jgi:hypothetical protein